MFDGTDTTTWNRFDIAVSALVAVLAGALTVAILVAPERAIQTLPESDGGVVNV